jgi:hypothetical protein
MGLKRGIFLCRVMLMAEDQLYPPTTFTILKQVPYTELWRLSLPEEQAKRKSKLEQTVRERPQNRSLRPWCKVDSFHHSDGTKPVFKSRLLALSKLLGEGEFRISFHFRGQPYPSHYRYDVSGGVCTFKGVSVKKITQEISKF